MRSINARRVAAVAAGAAMIGSVMASGFAAVTQQGDVAGFVTTIKDNLDNVNVVVGKTADISDGIAAAKIAARLASLNFVEATPAATGEGSAGTCTVTEKKVTVESSTTALETTTSDNWKIEYVGDQATAGGAFLTTLTQNDTMTYQTMSNLLKQETIKPTINGSAYTVSYDDRINVYYGGVRFDASSSTATPGHGIYYHVPTSTGMRGGRGLTYSLVFGGNGLPIGTTANQNYQNWPEVNMLGSKVTIDPVNTQAGRLALGTGAQYTVTAGESITSGDYGIKVDSIGQTTSAAGIQMRVAFTVTKTNTSETEKAGVLEGGTQTFFNEKVRITVQSVTGNTAILRVGVGTTTFTTDQAWTLNGGTTTTTEWVLENVSVTGNFLNAIILRYGNPSNTGMKYDFTGTYLNGLAQGVVLNGPLKADGKPFFKAQLKGFGSKSNIIDTTKVTFEGKGVASDMSGRIKTTWVSRDGTENTWDPMGWNYIAYPFTNTTPAANAYLNMSLAGSYPQNWIIINDKVVYLESALLQSGSTTLYDVVFRIGGPTGTAVTVTGVNITTPGVFRVDSTVNPIRCNVVAYSSNSINVSVDANFVANMAAGTDRTTGACDFLPNIVPIGKSTEIATAGQHPWLDMRWAAGNNSTVGNTSGVNNSGIYEAWPMVSVFENASDPFTVTYDDNDTATADIYRGLRVYNVSANESGYLGNITNAYIQLAQMAPADNAKYRITRKGTEISTTGTTYAEAVIPETQRRVIAEIAAEISSGANVTGTTSTYTSFPVTIGSVTIKAVDATLSTTDATGGTCSLDGTYYKMAAKAAIPESLVVTDAEAEGSSAYLVVVGGPWVNSIAAGMANSDLTTEVGAQYLIAGQTSLLAAGYSATDTMAAADELVDLLA